MSDIPPGIKFVKDLEYARPDGSPLCLDLYLPDEPKRPLPLVISIHGGGWCKLSKDPATEISLTSYGFANASIDYRLAPGAHWPAQMHDCKAAVRFLRANAATYGLDPNRFAAVGGSAGGHLSAVLAASNGNKYLEGSLGNHLDASSALQAVCDACGPTDFFEMSKFPMHWNPWSPDSNIGKLLGGRLLDKVALARSANPITYISKNTPPFLVIHGLKDVTIPFNQSELLVAALQRADIPVKFVPIPDACHYLGEIPANFDYAIRLMSDFFHEHMK